MDGENRETLKITGKEQFDIIGIADNLCAGKVVQLKITYADGAEKNVNLKVRLDTNQELEYYKNGGILHYVLRNIANDNKQNIKAS